MQLIAEVEQALGPGVDFERDEVRGLVGTRIRPGGAWLGFDRGGVVDSDDGRGRRLPILVALPASTHAGARLAVDVVGGWRSGQESVLLGRVEGGPAPIPSLARAAGALDGPLTWLDADEAARAAREAHERFRERRSHARIVGGRAWHALGALPPELARFATPHSAAEYNLAKMPPRFVRGLEGLLDDDERLLYWVERPAATDVGLMRRLRRGVDRRAAILALTDRQLLWIVDHAQPDQFLSDWGLDVELIPVERLEDVRTRSRGDRIALLVVTPAGEHSFELPIELSDEVAVMRDLMRRFVPSQGTALPRRRYAIDAIAFDPEPGERFGQEEEARALHAAAASEAPLLAFLLSPRRPGHPQSTALVLRDDGIELLGPRPSRASISEVAAIGLSLSPLVGRLQLTAALRLIYPAPLFDRGAAFARLARRVLANA